MAKDIEMVRKQVSKDDFTCICAPDNVSNIRARNHKEEELNYFRKKIVQLILWREREYLQRKNEPVGESDAERKDRNQGYTSWYVEERLLLIDVPNSEQ